MIFCGLLRLKLIVRKSITYSTSLASTPDRDSSKKLDRRSIILQLLLLLASYLISIVYFSYCPKSARASCFSLLTSSSWSCLDFFVNPAWGCLVRYLFNCGRRFCCLIVINLQSNWIGTRFCSEVFLFFIVWLLIHSILCGSQTCNGRCFYCCCRCRLRMYLIYNVLSGVLSDSTTWICI